MRRQKLCLLFRTTCSQVLQTKLFEFLIYAKEEQLLCNFPLGDLFSQPSAHPSTARQELDFIEPLRSPNSLWSSGLWWSREPFWNCPQNWAPLRGKCSGWWTGKLFSHSRFLPFFYFLPSYLSGSFFPSPPFFSERNCIASEEKKRQLRNRWERIVPRLLRKRDCTGDAVGKNPKVKSVLL